MEPTIQQIEREELNDTNDPMTCHASSSYPLMREESSTENKMTSEEKWGVFILHTLYFIQGIPLGLFGYTSSVAILLTASGANFSDIGILSLCVYPFSFKMLFAPIEDTHFNSRFGKRKSYIIPLQYTLSLLFIISSFMIEDLILSRSIGILFMVGFIMVLAASLQDIAVDGWNLTILQNHNLKWGSVAQSVGQELGILLGGTILIQLSSTKFCNEYFYSEPSSTPMITVHSFFLIFALVIIFITVWVQFFVKEKNPASMDEFPTVWALVKHLKGFYYNKTLRFYIIVQITWRLFFFTVSSSFHLKLIQQGFPKETVASVLTCMIPINLAASFAVGKYVEIGKEFTSYYKIYALHLINDVIQVILVNYYSYIGDGLFLFIYIIVCIIHSCVNTAMFVIQGGFNNRISDEEMGGTYLTFLNSVGNLGRMGANSLIFFLLGAFNYNLVVFCGWTYIFIYFFFLGKRILDLEKLEKREWKL